MTFSRIVSWSAVLLLLQLPLNARAAREDGASTVTGDIETNTLSSQGGESDLGYPKATQKAGIAEKKGTVCSLKGKFKKGKLVECHIPPADLDTTCQCPGSNGNGTVFSQSQDKDPKFAAQKNKAWGLLGESAGKNKAAAAGEKIKVAEGSCVPLNLDDLDGEIEHKCRSTGQVFDSYGECVSECP